MQLVEEKASNGRVAAGSQLIQDYKQIFSLDKMQSEENYLKILCQFKQASKTADYVYLDIAASCLAAIANVGHLFARLL